VTQRHAALGIGASLLGVVLPLSGCDRASAKSSKPGPSGSSDSGKRVVVVKPTRQDVTRTVDQPATVYALNAATLFAQVAGYLTSIEVDKGDAVTPGKLIATIEVPELRAERQKLLAQVAQSRAELAAAKVELERSASSLLAAQAGENRADADLALKKSLYERAKDLRKDGVVSVQDLEVAEGGWKEAAAALTLAQARVKEAEAVKHETEAKIDVALARVDTATSELSRIDARLSYSTILSPLKGIVTRRYVDKGALIQQATSSSTQAAPIVDISEIDRVRVDFQVPEKDAGWVEVGQPVTLRVDVEKYKDRVFSGTVTRFAGALDAARTMLVEAEYDNADHALMPGMFGTASLETGRSKSALTLPPEAVVTKGADRVVFVVTDGVVHKKKVVVGFDRGWVVEIKEGLGPSDAVVLGAGRLTDGMKVVPIERSEEGHEAMADAEHAREPGPSTASASQSAERPR